MQECTCLKALKSNSELRPMQANRQGGCHLQFNMRAFIVQGELLNSKG